VFRTKLTLLDFGHDRLFGRFRLYLATMEAAISLMVSFSWAQVFVLAPSTMF